MTKNLISLFLLFISFCSLSAQSALDFGGTNAYVTFGSASGLGLSQFTLECWFKREGTGVSTSTGTGGITAIPLIAKGRAEADGSNLDMNYFLGISTTNNVLAADFEEINTGPNPGLNHPVMGITPIINNVWYHGAVTYDGNTWKLYLNGVLEATVFIGLLPQSGSIQHASVASALNSSGTAAGYFDGIIDEVRVWNYARSQSQIILSANSIITSAQPGLTACWNLDDGAGTITQDISGNNFTGTIANSNWQWTTTTAPFFLNLPPLAATNIEPADGDSCQNPTVQLCVNVNDPEGDPMDINFYLRPKPQGPADFSIAGLPDTQFYTAEMNSGTNSIFKAQNQWIVNNRIPLNIAHVCHFGDCVQNGDNGGDDIEWKRADTAMQIIEDPVTTLLADGIPYTMNVGNHDQSPFGNPTGTTTFFNQYFGVSRFQNRNYWGGNFTFSNDNNYQFFSASGEDFIVISLEYDQTGDTAVLHWADSLLNVYSSKIGIIVSHYLLDANGTFSTQGQTVYDFLKSNQNLKLMLCGHVPNGEAWRVDTYNGNTIYTILADYQSRTNGGDGWMRIMTFSPTANTLSVSTYSPTLNQYETDQNSQFVLPFELYPNPYGNAGTAYMVPSGNNGCVTISGLMPNTTYQWYCVTHDGTDSTTSAVWEFTTSGFSINLGNDTTFCQGTYLLNGGNGAYQYQWNTGDTTQLLSPPYTGLYSVMATNTSSECTATDTIMVTVNTSPTVALASGSFSFCGTPATINIQQTDSNFNPSNTYSWSTGDTGYTATILNSGIYQFSVTTPSGCTSVSPDFTVLINPLISASINGDSTGCANSPVTLTASPPGVSYSWSTGDMTDSVSVNTSGVYELWVNDPLTGCTGYESLLVIIFPNPVISLGGDFASCGDTSLCISGPPNMTWIWSDGSNNPCIPITQSGDYSISVSVNGCEGNDSISATIHTPPIVDLGPDLDVLPGSVVNLNAGNGFLAYSWSTGDSTASVSIPAPAFGVWVVVTDSSLCSATDTINIFIVMAISPIQENVTAKLFPVPVSSILNVSLSTENILRNCKLIIYNEAGLAEITLDIPEITSQNSVHTFNLSKLPSGFHELILTDEKGIIQFSGKFMKE